MLLSNKALLDQLLLELSHPLLSRSFPPVCCCYRLFLSSLVSLSTKSLSSSCSCDEVPYSVADLVVNIVLVEVLGSLPLPLPLFHRACQSLPIPC